VADSRLGYPGLALSTIWQQSRNLSAALVSGITEGGPGNDSCAMNMLSPSLKFTTAREDVCGTVRSAEVKTFTGAQGHQPCPRRRTREPSSLVGDARPEVVNKISMSIPEVQVIDQAVNTVRYPLSEPTSAAWRTVVTRAQHELRNFGCSVLPGFIRPFLHDALKAECEQIAPLAHYDVEVVNAYNIATDTPLPDDHPGRVTMERGNAFVARDRIPKGAIIHQLYASQPFQNFVASCFELPRVFQLADPLAGLCLNVIDPGMEHPWHFDTNEFAVSMLTREAEVGGIFEYCPNIRSAQAENFDDVRAVLAGSGEHLVRRLSLLPGDLQLFMGRYSLHRVTQVQGDTARHSVIFAYSERPGVIGNPARTKQLFGRVLPVHLAGARNTVRGDQLLD